MSEGDQLRNISLEPDQMLVEPEWLKKHLDVSNIRIFDTTGKIEYDSELGKFVPWSNRAHFTEGHIVGANYLDLYDELSDRSRSGMYPLPTTSQFENAMSNKGIGTGTVVVLYSAIRPSWATRVWWLLKYHGFDQVVVLNGGWEKWQDLGYPITTEVQPYPTSSFTAVLHPERLATKDDVIEATKGSSVLINALSKAQFDRSDTNHFGRPGRIPTSKNLPYLQLLEEGLTTFLPPSEIKRLTNEFQNERAIAYYGGGIGATAIAFAFELAGYNSIAVYSGSMEE